MVATGQAEQRADSFTGGGKRPSRTPSHQVVSETGISWRTFGSRTKPVSGRRGNSSWLMPECTASGRGKWAPWGPVLQSFMSTSFAIEVDTESETGGGDTRGNPLGGGSVNYVTNCFI